MAEIMDIKTEPTMPAQTTAPDTEPTGWMSPEGDLREGAPENIKTLLDSKQWTNISQLATGYEELQKLVGVGDPLFIPKDDDIEGWDKLHNKLGRPATHDKYDFKYEGEQEISPELVDLFKQHSFKQGKSQKMFEADVLFQLEAASEAEKIFQTQQTERREENIQSIKSKWGEHYDPTIQRIDVMADKLGVKTFFEEMGIDKEPEVVNMLLTLANGDAESTLAPSTETEPIQKSPLDELNELKKSKAFLEKFDPDHKKTMERFMQLNQQIVNAGQGRAPRS